MRPGLAVKILGLSSFDHVKFVQVSKLGYQLALTLTEQSYGPYSI